MAQTIKLKRSATSGAIPSTASLELGEVAINTYDGKMYIKKNVGGTETVVEVGAGGGGGGGLDSVSYLEAGMIEYEYTATLNQTTFSGADDNSATLSYTAESILVFLNGILQDDGVDYTATNGTSVVFSVGLAAADEVRIVSIANVTTLSTLNNPTKLDAISTVDGQAAYSLTLDTSAYTPSSETALIVSLNGITQEPGDSFTTSGSTITFAPALVTGDVIDYIVDMGRAVPIGEYSGDLAVGGNLTVGGESTFSGDIILSGFPESIYELKGDVDGGIRFTAQAGEALSKGDIVYISGAAGDNTIVSKAQANSSSTMPAFGFVLANASNGAPCQIVTFGNLYGSGGAPLDTSAFNVGDTLYVSATTAGGFTSTPPAGESNLLQNIGKIVRSHSNNGVIKVGGAGRINAVPNLDDGDIFIGNASNQAVSASLNTKIEEYLDSGNSTPTFSTLDAGNTTLTGYLRGPSTFTIDPAAHGDDTGTLVVAGNLQVDGTTTTINSTTMTVDDLNITLASGAANAAAANGAGITVDGASATLTYNGTNDDWNFNKNLNTGKITATVDSNIAAAFSSTTTAAKITLADANDTAFIDINASRIGIGHASSTSLQALQIEPTSAEAMRIDSSGNVGIGTGASVSQRLHVLDTDVTPLLLQRDGATSDAFGSGLLFGNDFSNNGVFIFGAPSSGIRFGYTTDITSTNPVTTGTEVMRIDASGNVGIGTDSPDSKLVVSNGAAASGVEFIPATGSASLVSIERASNAFEPFRYRALDHRFETGASQSEAMRIDANGRVGVGTNNPGIANSFTDDHVVNNTGGAGAGYTAICADDDYSGYRLGNVSNTSLGIVDGNFDSSGDGTMRVLSKDVLVLGTGNFVERMRINSSGNVGVGTSSPTGVTSGITTLAISDAGSKTTGDKNGALAFITNDGSYTGTYADGVTAEIASVADSATGAAYGLSFLTSTITSSNRAERMRIDSSGTVQFQNAIREKQYNLVGTAIVPTNGTIQYKTLSANTTFTESLSDGEYVTLMIDDGAGYTITWPTTTWVGGSAPTLETAGYNVIELWQVNSVLYGAFVGAA